MRGRLLKSSEIERYQKDLELAEDYSEEIKNEIEVVKGAMRKLQRKLDRPTLVTRCNCGHGIRP